MPNCAFHAKNGRENFCRDKVSRGASLPPVQVTSRVKLAAVEKVSKVLSLPQARTRDLNQEFESVLISTKMSIKLSLVRLTNVKMISISIIRICDYDMKEQRHGKYQTFFRHFATFYDKRLLLC